MAVLNPLTLGQKDAANSLPVVFASDQTLPVEDVTPTALLDGTQAGAAVAAALNGGTSQPCSFLLVQNAPTSAGNLLVGNATSQSFVLIPGNAESMAIDDVNKVYIKLASESDATANWHAI